MSILLDCSVTHLGVPIGRVDLEIGDTQALGTLSPLPAYELVRPRILAAGRLGPAARVELLTLQADRSPSHPAIAAAALTLELWDSQGAQIQVDMVRLVELETQPGVTLLAELRTTAAGQPARQDSPRPADGRAASGL